MQMKKKTDNIGNRTRDLPVCSAVPQPTVPPRPQRVSNTVMFFALGPFGILLRVYLFELCVYEKMVVYA
jgi:hypothetical protein